MANNRMKAERHIQKVLSCHGWTQQELAGELGCGKNTIKAWLDNGAPRYALLAMERLCPQAFT
jgi:transcriptional regulator with XRE-family HTH domain